MNILIFGFSVTGMANSFAHKIRQTINSQETTVDICSLGGLHPNYAAFLISDILQRRQYNYVFLEVFTSMYRNPSRSDNDYYWPIWFMSEACLRMGATPILLSLYRQDVNYSSDSFGLAGRRVSELMGIPYFDLAMNIANQPDRNKYFIDEVHPSPKGDQWYTEQILPIIQNCIDGKYKIYYTDYIFERDALFIYLLSMYSSKHQVFDKSGYITSYVELSENETFHVSFDASVEINAISYLMGPRTGYLSINCKSGESNRILAYDSYCYYERFHVKSIKPVLTESISIFVEPVIPNIELRKGERDNSSRVGKLCQLLCSIRPLEITIRDAQHAWFK